MLRQSSEAMLKTAVCDWLHAGVDGVLSQRFGLGADECVAALALYERAGLSGLQLYYYNDKDTAGVAPVKG